MATAAAAIKPSSSSASATPARAADSTKRPKDACDLVDADHKAVKAVFKEYESLSESRSRSTTQKRQLADQICKELTVHAALEEEIFYPAVRKATKDNDLMNEATVEAQLQQRKEELMARQEPPQARVQAELSEAL